jgi:predicted AlkP superfamily phosphohydrolase/phosphomutase
LNKKKLIIPFLLAILAAIVIGILYFVNWNRTEHPIILVGIDGLEWDVILPLLKRKQLPNIARLMENGYYSELDTIRPTDSPVIWTSVATGKDPKKHGILDFARHLPNGEIALYNNSNRKTKAIWNILSDYGKTVHTIGWMMTFPVEEIQGIMVAQTNTEDQLDTKAGKHVWKGTLINGVKGQVYPPNRQNEMLALANEAAEDLPELTKQIFGEFRYPLSPLHTRLWDNCLWSFRADTAYHRITLRLIQENPLPDLLLLYFGGTDVVSHRFWRYMQPDIYKHKPTPEQIANLGTVIEDYYAYVDWMMGQLFKYYKSDTTIIVISDHGFQPARLNARFNPNDLSSITFSAYHDDSPPGIFIAAVPHIRKYSENPQLKSLKREDLESAGSVLDIIPTILAMMQIPVGNDMDGKLMKKIFNNNFLADLKHDAIVTHDTDEFFTRRPKNILPHPGEKERLEQLRSLGYITDSKKKEQPQSENKKNPLNK